MNENGPENRLSPRWEHGYDANIERRRCLNPWKNEVKPRDIGRKKKTLRDHRRANAR